MRIEELTRQLMDVQRELQLLRRAPQRLPKYGVSGGKCCKPRWDLRVIPFAMLTSGTFQLIVTHTEDGEDVETPIDVPHDATKEELLELINAIFDNPDELENISKAKTTGGPLGVKTIVIGTTGSRIKYLAIGTNSMASAKPALTEVYKAEDLEADDE